MKQNQKLLMGLFVIIFISNFLKWLDIPDDGTMNGAAINGMGYFVRCIKNN